MKKFFGVICCLFLFGTCSRGVLAMATPNPSDHDTKRRMVCILKEKLPYGRTLNALPPDCTVSAILTDDSGNVFLNTTGVCSSVSRGTYTMFTLVLHGESKCSFLVGNNKHAIIEKGGFRALYATATSAKTGIISAREKQKLLIEDATWEIIAVGDGYIKLKNFANGKYLARTPDDIVTISDEPSNWVLEPLENDVPCGSEYHSTIDDGGSSSRCTIC